MKRFIRLYLAIALAISFIPSVFASAIDVLEQGGNFFFSIASLSWITDKVPATKFALFIVIFSLIYAILGTGLWTNRGLFQGSNGKKVAGVVAFSFAAISIIFMPDRIAFATGSMISGVFAVLLICIVPGLLLFVTFKVTAGGSNAWKHGLRIIAILICITLISMIAEQYDGAFGYFLVPLMFIARRKQ
jgi:hypothetical protein